MVSFDEIVTATPLKCSFEDAVFVSTELRSNVDSWDNAPEDAGSKARIAKFLEVPVPERSWPLASVPLAPSFQHDLKKAMPSRSSASCRTRKITKPDEFLARVRAEGIKLPVFRRMGKPALASVSCSSPSGVTIPVVEPIVPETPKELENVIPEVERPKLQSFLEKKKKLVVEGPNKKRKAISIGHPSSVSFGEISVEPGDELLNQYAQAKVTESGLEDLAAKLISSMVQSLQCALVLGTSHRDLQQISDRSKTFANELEIAKKTNELKCKRLYERLEEAETASRRSSIEATGARLDLKECKEELELAQSELESLRHSQEYLSIYHNMSGRLEILTKPPGTYNLQEELRTFKHLYGGDSTFDEFIIQDADVRDRAVEQNAEDDIQGLAGNKSSSS